MADKCEHTGPRGRCDKDAVDGSNCCGSHSNEAERVKGYRLTSPELKERFEHFSREDLFSSLGQEVRLLRAMIEDRMCQAVTPAERITAFNAVRPALVDVVKCVETLSKLERQNNIVLGKDALSWLSEEIITILIGELEQVPDHERIVDSVAQRISQAIADARNQE